MMTGTHGDVKLIEAEIRRRIHECEQVETSVPRSSNMRIAKARAVRKELGELLGWMRTQ